MEYLKSLWKSFERKKQQGQAQANTACSDKKDQEAKVVHMWPQRPNSCNLQSKEPAIKHKKSNQVKKKMTKNVKLIGDH